MAFYVQVNIIHLPLRPNANSPTQGHITPIKCHKFTSTDKLLLFTSAKSACPLVPSTQCVNFWSEQPYILTTDFHSQWEVSYEMRCVINVMTKSLLHLVGANPALYSSHRYRIGAAITTALACIPESLIPPLGDGKVQPIFGPPLRWLIMQM